MLEELNVTKVRTEAHAIVCAREQTSVEATINGYEARGKKVIEQLLSSMQLPLIGSGIK